MTEARPAVPFEIVVAADEERGIGRDGDLAWRLRGDMRFFKRLTTDAPDGRQNAVIMGRKTWESIPSRFRPLPDRKNVVLSRTPEALELPDGVLRAGSLDEALSLCAGAPRVFVIGGAEIYRIALEHPGCQAVHLTRVRGRHGCDAFLAPLPPSFVMSRASEEHSDGGVTWDFALYERSGEDGGDA